MLRYFSTERRRRVAPFVLLLGAALVGKLAYDDMPRDEPMRFELPSRDVAALRVTYSAGDESYGGFEEHFPHGAPRSVSHAPQLAPGRYELAIELTDGTGKRTRLTRSIRVPAEGTVKIALSGDQ